MPKLALLRFIPFRRADILQMCLQEGQLDAESLVKFKNGARQIERHFRDDFHRAKHALKDAYFSLDPDADTRLVHLDNRDTASSQDDLARQVSELLERANYDKVTPEVLSKALDSASLFDIRLVVNLDDFAEVLLYTRGASEREEVIRGPFNLWRKTVRFVNYDRVVLYLRFKDEMNEDSSLAGCRPGATMLKLFQNVPDADMEMLFPNTQVGMRLRDKLMIGIPALVSGGVVLTTKLGATLVLTGSLLGFWLGWHNDEVTLDRKAIIVLLAGAGTIGAYLWKQISNFKNRKLRFNEALTRNLYFKLLDNNAGVLYRLLDDAEESECKESLLAYYFLLAAHQPLSAQELDQRIEVWFSQRWQCRLDFDVDDALQKLAKLNLAYIDADYWHISALSADVEG
ncbi:TMEM143 family protein [Zhongshania sp.]|uniref:TMEM143 family protein n=1 Tax=Zhongshania sp. TaxID=1971902 RepID=UPI0035687067